MSLLETSETNAQAQIWHLQHLQFNMCNLFFPRQNPHIFLCFLRLPLATPQIRNLSVAFNDLHFLTLSFHTAVRYLFYCTSETLVSWPKVTAQAPRQFSEHWKLSQLGLHLQLFCPSTCCLHCLNIIFWKCSSEYFPFTFKTLPSGTVQSKNLLRIAQDIYSHCGYNPPSPLNLILYLSLTKPGSLLGFWHTSSISTPGLATPALFPFPLPAQSLLQWSSSLLPALTHP